MKGFVINFVGLKDGKHDYDFDIDEKFFGSLDYSIVEKGKIKMNMTLEKKPGVLLLTFNFKGFIDAVCDRCGDEFQLPLEGEDHLTVKYSPTEYDEESEDVVLLEPQANSVDVTHYIYEIDRTGSEAIIRTNRHFNSDETITPDTWLIPESDVIGSYSAHIPYIGYVIDFITSLYGIVVILINVVVITAIVKLNKQIKEVTILTPINNCIIVSTLNS